jgi:peptide/nickel transport system substrate-binding protein
MRSRRQAVAGAMLIGCGSIAALAACSAGGTGASGTSGSGSQTFTMGIPEEPDTLDPQTTNAAISRMILRYAGDTLVDTSPSSNGEIVPGLAKSWQSSANGLQWTFQLKSGVKFQNNDPVNAAAVVASFKRAMSPSTKAGTVTSVTKPIKDVVAEGSNTVVFDLKQPYSLFLQNLTDPSASILDAKVADAEGDKFGRAPVLTGAWKVTQWVSGDHITLTRNPAYDWGPSFAGKGPAKLQTLKFEIIPDNATQVSALESGEIQALDGVPTPNMKSFAANPSFKSYEYLRPGVGLFLEFNVSKAPFSDVNVRKALQYAIDPKQLVQVALLNQGSVACGPLPPSIPGYWSGMCNYAPKYDPARAKALLAQAGWKPGPNGILQKNGTPLNFTLYSSATPATWSTSAQLIQQQLKAVGIGMTIQNFEFGTLLSKAQAGADAAHLMGYTYNTADILDLWFRSTNSGAGLNLSHIKDPHLDALIDAYQNQTTTAGQAAALVAVQKYITDLALWVPLWVPDDDIATTSQLQGALLSKQGYLVLNQAHL